MGFGIGTMTRAHGVLFPFESVAPILRRGDIVFGNCEGVISDIGANPCQIDSMEFRGLPRFAEALRTSGFTVLNVANNHTGEHGEAVFLDTVNNLESAGITVVGLRGTTQISSPVIQQVKGLRIGWLGYTWITSKHNGQDRKMLACPGRDDPASEVEKLRSEVDFLIVTAHWGNEFVPVPPQRIIDQAHAIADAGADLILGHHPHVLQGTERFGKSLIVYSLGNFLFDMWQPNLRETALFRCEIRNGEIVSHDFVPVKLNRQFQPTPATSRSRARIFKRIERSSQAISEPALNKFRDNQRAKKNETWYKYTMIIGQIPYLLISLRRMGFRIAYQKLCRRVRFLPPLA